DQICKKGSCVNVVFDDSVMGIVENCWIGTELARKLGVENRFFSRFASSRPKSLNDQVEIYSTGGLVLVKIPTDVSEKIRSGEYVINRIAAGDDAKYDFVFGITCETRIGFWR
ncbi:MAG: hypothetical protein ABXS91_10925, partial [Sulfurimonas sp.]